MTWDVPTAEDCPVCGQTLFKKSGRGRQKTFCVNENCPNFLPEDQRGYYKKTVKDENGEPAPETAETAETATKTTKKATKTAAKKTTAKKTATTKKTAAKKSASKTTTAKKATKKAEA